MEMELKQRIQQALPYFIQIYGEEFKDIIVAGLNRIEPIVYSTVQSKKYAMYNMQAAKRVELTIRFLEYNNIYLSDEVKTKMIKSNKTDEIEELPDAEKLLRACFGSPEYREVTYNGIKTIPREPTDNEYIIEKSVGILKNLGIYISAEKFNEWILTDEAKEVFARIEKLSEYIDILDIEFREFDKQFDDLKPLIEKSDEIERKTNEKYMVEFLKSIEKYTSEYDKKLLELYLSSDKKDWYSFQSKIDIFKVVGNSFDENSVIESFSSKADEKMNDPSVSQFSKETIIEDRIKYYRLIGLYKDQMPKEEFLLTEEARVNIPKQEFMDEITAKKKYFKELAEKETVEITSSYKDNLEQINNLDLETNVGFTIDKIIKGTMYIDPNTRTVNGYPELVTLLFFSPEGCLQEYIDVTLIHELNHAIELSLVDYTNGKSLYKCGFEFLCTEEDEVRDYVEFSEVMNQVIAMEVTEAMHRDGVYLFDNPNTSKIQGGTSYEQQRNFIRVFWEKFRKDIIRARVSNNLNSLYHVVGKENFDKLNKIINEYSTLPYFEMMDDVVNNRVTELTKKRMNLLNDTMDTCERMIEHAKWVPSYENVTGDNHTMCA